MHSTHAFLSLAHLAVAALILAHVISSEPGATQLLSVEHLGVVPEHVESSMHATQADPLHTGNLIFSAAHVASLNPATTQRPKALEHTGVLSVQ